MQDLDIRGAGNLLGAEQSGFITEMGFETYQKILSEAMEELGVEQGITVRNERTPFVQECSIETDQCAYIPEDYININAEKIRIYKDIDSMTSEKEIQNYTLRLEDRFGPVPEELKNLLLVLRLRNLGASIGFEKIIVMNGILIAFFVSNPMSPYYKSKIFEKVMENIALLGNQVEIKQNENKLKIVARNIPSLPSAYKLISKLR